MIVAQLSDPHVVAPGQVLYGRVDTPACLARAVMEVNSLDPLPDVTVITGDLVGHETPAEYEHLRQILAPLRMPMFVIPGNHDSRQLHLWRDGLVTHTAVIGDWPGPYSLRPTG